MLFANPGYFWLFLIYIPLIAWYIRKHKHLTATMAVSSTSPFASLRPSWRGRLRHLLFILQLLAIGCVIVVIARPQSSSRMRDTSTEGTDIVIALDISGSMQAMDLKPNRLEAAKKVGSEFVAGRENDKMGVVLFAGEAFTYLPLTTDRAFLANNMQKIRGGMILNGQTAIGDAIATAINRIKNGKAKSKSIILITDGSNNTGTVEPITAAEIAAKYGIKVYTVGVGTNGEAPVPDGMGGVVSQKVDLDEPSLTKIAEMTNAKYFRATDNNTLEDIFTEIDRLEKSQIDTKDFSNTDDDYMMWGWLALAFMGLSMLLRFTVLRSNP